MHDLAITVLLGAQCAAIFIGLRRFGWSATPTLFGLYLVAAQGVAWLAMHDLVNNEMFDLYGGADREADLFWAIIAAACLFAWLYTLCAATGLRSAPKSVATISKSPPPLALASGCAVAWAVLFLPVITTADWRLLWSTAHYLDLTDAAILTQGALAGIALNALPAAGAASAVLAAILYVNSKRPHLLAAILLMQAGATMIWLLAAHSRAAALLPAAFAFTIVISSGPRAATGRLTFTAMLAIIALASALSGRNLGEHGLASLGALPGHIIDLSSWAPALAVNITEGIFAVAAGLGEWRAGSADSISFPAEYIWLSFSPLPSAIDGFARFLDAQVRLHAFAPMPGYVELAWFGPWAQLGFIGLITLGLRLATKVTEAAPILGAIVGALLAACLYLMAAYPVRTALKPLWLCLATSAAIITVGLVRRNGLSPPAAISTGRRP